MSVSVPNGSIVAIASGYGSPITFTAISNASPPVVTSTAHGLSTGDFVEITSGWSRLNEKVVRITKTTNDAFTIDGIDTTSTTTYPIGTGTGTVRKITGWTQLTQILSTSTAGGEQQFLTFQFMESDAQVQIPTSKSPMSLTLSIADDPTLAGYILASTANDDRLQRAIKFTLPGASLILFNGYISLNKTPSMTVNEVMACQATISLRNEVVRYAS